jgi:hypothetical protein
MANASLTTEKLAALIEDQLSVLERLCTLSQDQKELIHCDDRGELLVHLSRKQRLFDELQTIQDALTSFQSERPEEREWSSAEQKNLCRQKHERCKQLLAHLTALESQSIEALSACRDHISSELQQFDRIQRVQNAYQQHTELDATESTLAIEM